MIGQDKLINKINNLTLDTFPRSLLLIGELGSGKKTLVEEVIRPKLNLSIIDITDTITLDIIYDIYLRVDPYIYLIDLNRLSVKKENTILKLLEEPLKNSFLILLSENKNGIIPTILNRCQIWELEKYSEEQLKHFLSTKIDNYPDYFYLTSIFNTPGQLLTFLNENKEDINAMIDTVNKMITLLGNSNFSNILNISNNINYKDDNTKWNYNIFCKLLIHIIQEEYFKTPNKKLYKLFIETKKLIDNNKISHINKQHLFENYLYRIKYILK